MSKAWNSYVINLSFIVDKLNRIRFFDIWLTFNCDRWTLNFGIVVPEDVLTLELKGAALTPTFVILYIDIYGAASVIHLLFNFGCDFTLKQSFVVRKIGVLDYDTIWIISIYSSTKSCHVVIKSAVNYFGKLTIIHDG